MKNSRYRYLYGTGTHYKSSKFLNFGDKTQFRYQIFAIPVTIPQQIWEIPGAKFFWYRFRDFFAVPNFCDNGFDTTTNLRSSWCQIFLIPVPRLFSGTKYFRYWYRYFFLVPNFSDTGSETFFRYQIITDTGSETFSGTNLFRYQLRYHQKNYKFLVWGFPGTVTSHSLMDLSAILWMFLTWKFW